MAEFFDKFPKVKYNLNTDTFASNNYDFPVDILTRVGFLTTLFDNIFLYYNYTIKDTDRPEIIAEKYYKDPEAHWMILLSNRVLDPFYDWPLAEKNFQKYIINKYGSIETAKITIQRYEKIVKTVDNNTSEQTVRKYIITQSEYDTLQDTDPTPVQKTFPDGNIVTIYKYRNLVYVYDDEFELNEKRRSIKLIKSDYYPAIKSEFDQIMRQARGVNVISDPTRRL